MSITTTQFIRKPLYVDAVRITGANFDEIAAWCQGEVQADEVPGKGTTKKYIKVRVHNPKNARQTKAFVGDWLLYTERGYKVYTNKAFRASFDETKQSNVGDAVEQTRVNAVEAGVAVETEVAPGITQTVPATPESIAQAVNENALAIAQEEDDGDVTYDDTIDLVPANPGIGETVKENVLEVHTDSDTPAAVIDVAEQPENVDTVPEQEKIDPTAAEGKKVLSIAEQNELTPDEVRELVQSGEAVLAQDIAAA